MPRRDQPKALRRPARRAILCLVFGAILQYLVAVAFSLDDDFPPDSSEWKAVLDDGENRASLTVEAWHGVGREIWIMYLLMGEPEWAGQQDFGRAKWTRLRSSEMASRFSKPRVPSWSYYPDVSSSWRLSELPARSPQDGYGVGCGWPWRSTSFYVTNDAWAGRIEVSGGFVAEQVPLLLPDYWFPRIIPLRIYWPGAIANTLLYAGVLLIPFNLIPLTRHHLRRRAGRCITCGYDLRGAVHPVCPECGTPHDRVV